MYCLVQSNTYYSKTLDISILYGIPTSVHYKQSWTRYNIDKHNFLGLNEFKCFIDAKFYIENKNIYNWRIQMS